MEASALTHAGRRGLLARRSPLLRLQGDERLIMLLRRGNEHAFEAIVDRYQARLLGFCRQMLGSTEDAEDVLQEVFVNAYRALIADSREIKLRPWLYRIARNRCLNLLRKPKAEGQESMDFHPIPEAASTHERVQNREEFRQLLTDVDRLPETQRAALLLREMDALSYEEIAEAMETTVPSVKSLLVRARIALADATHARQLTCGEVRVELAEAAEGLAKASGPVRKHVRDCTECSGFRQQLQSDSKALAALFPVGPLVLLKGFIAAKLGFGGSGAGASGAAASGSGAAGAASAGAGVAAGSAAIATGTGAMSGLGGVGAAAIGSKAVAGVVTAAVLTAGAVSVERNIADRQPTAPVAAKVVPAPIAPAVNQVTLTATPAPVDPPVVPAEPAATEPIEPAPPAEAAEPTVPVEEPTATEGDSTTAGGTGTAGSSVGEDDTVTVFVGDPTDPTPGISGTTGTAGSSGPTGTTGTIGSPAAGGPSSQSPPPPGVVAGTNPPAPEPPLPPPSPVPAGLSTTP